MSVQTTYATAPAAAYKGMLCDDTENDTQTMKNAEVSASMPFGNVVSFKTSSPTSDRDAVLPASGEQKLAGIIVHSHDYERTFTLAGGATAGELDSVGLVPGTEMTVLVRGTIWVQPELAVVPGDRLYVRMDADTNEHSYEVLGNVSNASDESDMIDATAIGRFISSCDALGFAKLQVDFSQKP
jgi:hypothetical protein